MSADRSAAGTSSVPGDRDGDEASVGPGPGVRWTGDGSLAPKRAPRWGVDGAPVSTPTSVRPVARREPTLDGIVLASAPKRLAAFAIDRAIKTAMLLALLSIAGIPWPTEPAIAPALTAASALLNAGYDFVFGIRGVTPAAYLLRIRITASNGAEPGARRSLVRAIFAALNELALFSGSLWMFFDARRRTLMDRVAGTIVTRSDR